jgi:type IV pilus assembly protein PilV
MPTMNLMKQRSQQGIVLLEAMIAAVILAIGLLGTVGLQARSYAALADASMRAEATIRAEQLIGVMTNDSVNLAAYKTTLGGAPAVPLTPWADDLKKWVPGATFGVTVTPGVLQSQVDIVIQWTRRKGDAVNTHTVTSYVKTPAPPVP